jgi:hypothetical protein
MPSARQQRLPYAHSLYVEHLGESVDACLRAGRFAQAESGLRPRERRFAIASVIHGYAGLEAIANICRFEAFGPGSGRGATNADGVDVATKRFLEDWRWVPLEDRCAFLMQTRKETLSTPLKTRIGEVRELRHLLAHGYTMPGVIVFDGGRMTGFEVSHRNKSHQLKFSRPDKLVYQDARKALEVLLRGAQCLADAFDQLFSLVSYELHSGGMPYSFGCREPEEPEGPVEKILKELEAELHTKASGPLPGSGSRA